VGSLSQTADWPADGVLRKRQEVEAVQVPEGVGDGSRQRVGVEVEGEEVGEAGDARGDGSGDVVEGQGESL